MIKAFLFVMVVAATASATPEGDVDALVRGTLDKIDQPASAGNFAKGAIVKGFHSNVFDFDTTKILDGEYGTDTYDFKAHGKLWTMAFAKEAPAGKRTLDKLTIVVDGQSALFEGSYAAQKRTLHVTGQAKQDGGTWKLSLLAIEMAVPDSELRKHPVLAPEPAVRPASPNDELGKAVVTWFTKQQLGKTAATGTPLATGSAPTEIFSGADAVKFAASLDKLKLVAFDIEPASNNIIHGHAFLAIGTEAQGQVEFAFTVYAVKDGAAWKWRAIHFACDQVPQW
ncbi:MAG: hypothetical protein QM831_32340 [Kofleriaceae bacterium]